MTTELQQAYRAVALAAHKQTQDSHATPATRLALAGWVLNQPNLADALTAAEIDELVQTVKARGSLPPSKRR